MKIKSKKGIIIISSLAIIIIIGFVLLFNIISKMPNADNVILPLQQNQQTYFQDYKNKNMRLDYENDQLYFSVNGFLNSKTLSFSDKSNEIVGNTYNNFQVYNNFIINLKDGKLTKHNLEDNSEELLFENINFFYLIKNNQKILVYKKMIKILTMMN